MSKRLIGLILGALAVGLIAGCGSSSSGDDSTVSLTKSEFIKKADTVCADKLKQIETEFNAYVKKHGVVKDSQAAPVQVAIAETVVLPRYREQAEELRALGAPSGAEAKISSMLDTFEEGVEEAEKDPLGTAKAGSPNFSKADKMAEDYGLKVCVIS